MEELFRHENLISEELLKFFEIGLNHEQQHQELLITDIKFILGSNPLLPAYKKSTIYKDEAISELDWLPVEEGVYEIGHQGGKFAFDNELGRHKVFIASFQCMNRLVCNEEYLEFMNDGGYTNPALWLSEGWTWVKDNKIQAPFYWFKKEQQWFNYTLSGAEVLRLNNPVTHINFFEAEAFARWKDMRLLTEFEWEVAANKYGSEEFGQFQDSNDFQPRKVAGNQFFGTAWEWTNSSYLPYPNYNQEEGALGEYNGKFMVNQMVLRGGSCATPKDHFRLTYRNFFHAHLQWQFTGIRLAKK
jgi:ergothioneine biosynthesis protein EgtB